MRANSEIYEGEREQRGPICMNKVDVKAEAEKQAKEQICEQGRTPSVPINSTPTNFDFAIGFPTRQGQEALNTIHLPLSFFQCTTKGQV